MGWFTNCLKGEFFIDDLVPGNRLHQNGYYNQPYHPPTYTYFNQDIPSFGHAPCAGTNYTREYPTEAVLTAGKCKMVRLFTQNAYGRMPWYCENCQKMYDMLVTWD